MQHTSDKLKYPEFIPSFNKEPLNVEYQTKTSDQFSSNGFSFYIKAPAQDALLDPDVWIKYSLVFKEAADHNIRRIFENNGVSSFKHTDLSGFCLREGHPVWRAMQNFSVQINGQNINCQPCMYIDEWNRLNVSLEQSSHEFSMSGGKFDNGNQTSFITSSSIMGIQKGRHTTVATFAANSVLGVKTSSNGFSHAIDVGITDAAAANTYNPVTLQRIGPPGRNWENDGIEERENRMMYLLREKSGAANAAQGVRFLSPVRTDGVNNWTIDLYERLPMRPFKMYDKDGVTGVIPNIKDLTIRAQFKNKFVQSICQAYAEDLVTVNFGTSSCEMYLIWYTPPYGMTIPREIAIPMQRIETYTKQMDTAIPLFTADTSLSSNAISSTQSNINLESIPDYLMIYVKPQEGTETFNACSPHNLEIGKIEITMEGASGKLSGMNTLRMYKNWLKYVKYKTEKEVHYDEWRKYNCVCVLKGEDLGLIKGAGLDNPCTLTVKLTDVISYYRYPTMLNDDNFITAGAGVGLTAGAALVLPTYAAFRPAQKTYNVYITQVYDKYALILRQGGTAGLELTRIATNVGGSATGAPLTSRVGLGALTL